MKKLRILGLVTILVLIVILSAILIIFALGMLKIEEKPDGSGSEIVFTPVEEKDPWEIPDSAERTAVIKTEMGDITIRLSDTAPAEEFINLDNGGAFEGAEFSVMAKDMFIQANINDPSFETAKTDFACVYGTVGFVMDGDMTSPSFFIITNKKLSGLSESYMKEQGFEKEKIAFYEEKGGMPEYEGKVVIFGKVISGMNIAEKIAKTENAGYTGGYLAETPVPVTDVEIIYPTETVE